MTPVDHRRTAWIAALVLSLASPGAAALDRVRVGAEVPVALAWGPEGRLAVALRDGREIALVEPGAWRVAARWPLPIRPASLALADDGQTLLVGGIDGEALALRDGMVIRRFASGLGPTKVLALPDGQALLGSQWDEAVRLVDLKGGRTLATHSLGFPTCAMVGTPEGRVVVADAFGGNLVSIVPGQVGPENTLRLDAVNLHGLAISGDGRELLAVHMAQDSATSITQTNIDWGLVLASKLSAVRLTELGVQGRRPNVRRLALDRAGRGAADPAALAVTPDGTKVLVALAGAHRLLLIDRTLGSAANADLLPLGDSQRLRDREVGRGPLAVVLDPAGKLAITADAMSDTLSVVSVDGLEPVATVPLGRGPRRPTAVQRGEAWFRDGRAAHDRWMSCASCHAGGHTIGLNFDTRGDDNYGAPKNIPTLLGCGPTAPYAWTGRFPDLDGQIRQSLETTLRGPAPRPGQVEDLASFLASLAPPPPRRPREDPAARRGAAVFRSRECATCHVPPDFTRAVVRDVGLRDANGQSRFNPPSLRGVSRTAPYFHDGRARTLRDALDLHHPGTDDPLPAHEAADLAAYLESL